HCLSPERRPDWQAVGPSPTDCEQQGPPMSRPPAVQVMRNLGLEPDSWQVAVLETDGPLRARLRQIDAALQSGLPPSKKTEQGRPAGSPDSLEVPCLSNRSATASRGTAASAPANLCRTSGTSACIPSSSGKPCWPCTGKWALPAACWSTNCRTAG